MEPTDIPAVVDLFDVMEVPKDQRIELLDLGIALDRQGEDILDRIDGWIGRAFQRLRLVIVKTIPLLVALHLQQLRAVLFNDLERLFLDGPSKVKISPDRIVKLM